jgi:hypothetical protein
MHMARALTRAGAVTAALVVCLATQAVTTSPTASGASQADPVDGAHVAVSGALRPTTSGIDATRLAVFVEPDERQQRRLEVGDTVTMLELPASTVTRTGNSYAVSVDPNTLPAEYVSDTGLVAFTVVGLGADNQHRGLTHASARRVTAPGHSDATWVSPDLPPAAQAAAAQDRLAAAPRGATVAAEHAPAHAAVHSNLEVRRASAARVRGDRQAAEMTTTDAALGSETTTASASYASASLQQISERMTTIGTTYPVGRTVARMQFTSGRATTTGVALWTGVGWEQEGTLATDAGFGKKWPNYGGARSYRVQIRYGKYSWCSAKYGFCETEWKPMLHTGQTGRNNLSSRPNFQTCRRVDSGEWWRDDTSGSAYKYGAGVKFKNVIGINLSSKRQYSSSNKIWYDIAGAKRLCGNGRVPALASKLMERFR